MKSRFQDIILLLFLTIIVASCKKSSLQLVNPNSPTPASLTTESGILDFALGVYQKWIADVPGEGSGNNIWEIVLANHSIMGDEEFIPWGNFGWRWVDQVYSITLPDSLGGKTIITPIGVPQKTSLQASNSRQAGELNAFMYEWEVCYFMIGQMNLLLHALENSDLHFSGDVATKQNTLKAWAYWWRGLCYSRIGSMYIAGIINNEPANGQTNGNFVDRATVLAEADHNFDSCLSILNTLQENADYDQVMNTIIPSFNQDPNGVITPDMWKRQIYSYKARNILVNKKVKDMTSTDWQNVLNLANQGVQRDDRIFWFGMNQDGVNDLTAGFWHPYTLHNLNNGFCFLSPRLIQDFVDTNQDLRYHRNFYFLPEENWEVNVRGRGLQFGTFWQPTNIEDGGSFSTNENLGKVSLACTYEETELMKAEANIYLGNIDQGLQFVDEVRDYQDAGLPHVANTGLSQSQAIAQLRSERRIALYLRGLAFYDARRWGITEPAAQGGGRIGWVIIPGSLLGGGSAKAIPCKMDYNYMDYFDVPQNELDFNEPAPGSVPVKQ